MPRAKRVLTKADASTEIGGKILTCLEAIADDGKITVEELAPLVDLLREAPAHWEGCKELLRVTFRAVRDGELDEEERYDIRCSIEAIAPKEMRARLSERLEGIQKPVYDPPMLRWIPATARQLEYIRILGGSHPGRLSRDEACDMIDQLKLTRPPSPRQRMVLRFWNKLDLCNASREEVSLWMDQAYDAEPAMLAAWEMYKRANHAAAAGNDPEVVPVGIGIDYLHLVKGQRRKGGWHPLLVIVTVIVIGLLIALSMQSCAR